MFTKLYFNAKYLVAKFIIYRNIAYINSLDIYIFFYLYNILEITMFYKTSRELEFRSSSQIFHWKRFMCKNFTNHFNIIVTY